MKNTWVLIVALFVLIAIVIIAIVRWRASNHNIKDKSEKYLPYANTELVRDMPEYQRAEHKYHLLLVAILGLFLMVFAFTSIIAARPVAVSTRQPSYENRDIMLCLDASGSMDVHIQELLEYFSALVPELKGQRIGLTVFSAYYMTLAPLSDDYDALLDVFETLGENANNYAYALTSRRSDPSMIGPGLVGCVNSFDKLDDEERSRSIILATDNDAPSSQKVSLPQAAKYAKRYNITVYGLSTSDTRSKNEIENANSFEAKEWRDFREAVLSTGGTYYAFSSWNAENSSSIREIVDQIMKESAAKQDGAETLVYTDIPVGFTIVALIGIVVLFVLLWRLSI